MGAPGQALIWGRAGPAARRGWGPESLWIRVFMTGCVITCRDAEAVKVNLQSCLSPSPTRSRPSVWGAGLQELCSRAGIRPRWQWRKKRLPCVHGGEGTASGPSPCCWLLPVGGACVWKPEELITERSSFPFSPLSSALHIIACYQRMPRGQA